MQDSSSTPAKPDSSTDASPLVGRLCVSEHESCSYPNCNCKQSVAWAAEFESRNRQFLLELAPNENTVTSEK